MSLSEVECNETLVGSFSAAYCTESSARIRVTEERDEDNVSYVKG